MSGEGHIAAPRSPARGAGRSASNIGGGREGRGGGGDGGSFGCREGESAARIHGTLAPATREDTGGDALVDTVQLGAHNLRS